MPYRPDSSSTSTAADGRLESQPLQPIDRAPTEGPPGLQVSTTARTANVPPQGPEQNMSGFLRLWPILQTVVWTGVWVLVTGVSSILLAAVRLMIALVEGYVAIKQSGNPVTKLKALLEGLYQVWLTRQNRGRAAEIGGRKRRWSHGDIETRGQEDRGSI